MVPTSVWLAADLVVLTFRDGKLKFLAVTRATEPFEGRLALPGGFIRMGETLEESAMRRLSLETGLDGSDLPFEQLQTYSRLDRDPRRRVVSTAFLAVAPNLPSPSAGGNAKIAEWLDVRGLDPGELAFDHGLILRDGVKRAGLLLEYTTIAAKFCSERFTLSELRSVYEAVWGVPIDPRNFRRKVTNTVGFVISTGDQRSNGRGRPAKLYRRGTASLLHPAILRGADAELEMV